MWPAATRSWGRRLRERLEAEGYCNRVGEPPDEPDLTSAGQVEDFFGEARPEYVFLAAGKSGGIRLNQERPAELMLHNLLVTAHVLDRCASIRRGETPLSGQLVQLSAERSAAAARRIAADGTARADQRGLRHRQARRLATVRGLPAAVRSRASSRRFRPTPSARTTISVPMAVTSSPL